MRLFNLSFFLLLCIALPEQLLAQEDSGFDPAQAEYLWPTDASPYLSSTFGETRSAHFHAALDIKTWGRRGYKIFATRDGVVHRISIGPRGYGKVIHPRHPDESYSVYAHLLGFNDTLQQLADSVRTEEDYSFVLDKFVGDRNISVQQGEVIGYSGSSGIGPPHLHFELRTPAQSPFNPLMTNLSVEDHIPPQMVGLSAEPLAVGSAIEGRNAIYTRRPSRRGNQYDFGAITVSGPVGLGLNVFDQADNVHNVYAVHELSMQVNGQELFKAQADSFSYQNAHQMFIDRVYPLLKKNREAYQRLFVADGNTLAFYMDDGQNGVLNLPPGIHEVTIRATDYFGNSSHGSVQLKVEEQDNIHPDSSWNTSPITEELSPTPYHWGWFDNWVTLPDEEFHHITAAISDSSDLFVHGEEIGLDLTDRDPLFMNIPDIGPLTLHRVYPESVGIVSSVDQQGFVRFPEHAFYDTVSVGMAYRELKKDSIQVDLIPEAYPVRENFQLRVRTDSTLDTSKLSFYKWNRRMMKWSLVPTSFDENYIIANTKSLGSFTTLRDTLAPELQKPLLKQRADGLWVITVPVSDDLSGVDYKRTVMTVNGVRGITEYEPEDDQFVYYNPAFSPTPGMEVFIQAYDNMGNKAEKSFLLEER